MEGSGTFPRNACGRLARAMTRCECAGLAFTEIERRLRAGQSLEKVQAETGAGLLCTACLPDLGERLAAPGALPGLVAVDDPR